jgi:hypothetical protein
MKFESVSESLTRYAVEIDYEHRDAEHEHEKTEEHGAVFFQTNVHRESSSNSTVELNRVAFRFEG